MIYNMEQDPVLRGLTSPVVSYPCNLPFYSGNRLATGSCLLKRDSDPAGAFPGRPEPTPDQFSDASTLTPMKLTSFLFLDVIKHRFVWTLQFFCIRN